MGTRVDRFFAYEHLPQHLQEISKPIAELAKMLDDATRDSNEKEQGMRLLLEAKDCFVRAKLPLPEGELNQINFKKDRLMTELAQKHESMQDFHDIYQAIADLATTMDKLLVDSNEKEEGMTKLLKAKHSFLLAAIIPRI